MRRVASLVCSRTAYARAYDGEEEAVRADPCPMLMERAWGHLAPGAVRPGRQEAASPEEPTEAPTAPAIPNWAGWNAISEEDEGELLKRSTHYGDRGALLEQWARNLVKVHSLRRCTRCETRRRHPKTAATRNSLLWTPRPARRPARAASTCYP